MSTQRKVHGQLLRYTIVASLTLRSAAGGRATRAPGPL